MSDQTNSADKTSIERHLVRAQQIAYEQGTVGKGHAYGGHRRSDWARKKFNLSDLDAETLNCPNCSKPFSQQTWKPYRGFDKPASGGWEYACPTDTCDTLFIFDRSYD